MNKIHIYIIVVLSAVLASCSNNKYSYDASGIIEAEEICISAQTSGLVKSLNVEEASFVEVGSILGYIDTSDLFLQKQLLLKNQSANKRQKPNANEQLASLREAIKHTELEYNRLEALYRDSVAKLQDLESTASKLKQLKAEYKAQSTNINNAILGIDDQSSANDIQIAQIENAIEKSLIKSPVSAYVTDKYIKAGEFAYAGQKILKLADLQNMYVRAYVDYAMLSSLKLGQNAKIFVKNGEKFEQYEGKVSHIANTAEFTPKTIQTPDERENLVFVVKISVENSSGKLKSGMYADVSFI